MSIIDTNVRSLNKSTFFSSFLTLNGNINSANDYSGGVTEFNYTNTDTSNTIFISDVIINIKDDGPFNMSEYAGTTALSNGINIYYTDTNGTNRNNIIGTTYNIKKNADFYNYTTDVKLVNNNTGTAVLSTNLNFQKNYSNIRLGVTDKIAVELNDNFSNLTEQIITIRGFKYANSDLI